MTGRQAVLRGLGAVLPSRLVTNAELCGRLDTTPGWIESRTGIGQRYWADGTATSDLAVVAACNALQSADADTADLVILATTTPDHPCPATAPDIAARLGLGTVPAFDIAAVCSGFVYALATAAGYVAAGLADSVLVIGADTYSTILDPADRTTSVLFGDGAGAVLLGAGGDEAPGRLLDFDLGSDGTGKDLIIIPGGGSRQRTAPDPSDWDREHFTMQGKGTFQQAVKRMSASARTVLYRTGWTPDSLDRLVAHQANIRILHAVADELGIPRHRLVIDLDRVGNTSAASIPLALAHAAEAGVVMPGQRVLLNAFGGGVTWASTALVWPEIKSCTTAWGENEK
jgi:3-oxoacyl-[acyl-carrier-protein] synthase III